MASPEAPVLYAVDKRIYGFSSRAFEGLSQKIVLPFVEFVSGIS